MSRENLCQEKSALTSKKFIAFLVCEVGFFALMGAIILSQGMAKLGDNLAFMILTITSGTLASFYIGGQALVDRYIRVATIMAGRSENPTPSEPKKELREDSSSKEYS